jgi:hypothetical protein
MLTRQGKVNETHWTVGEWVEANNDGLKGLCSDGYVHWYADSLLAVLLNPIHADIDNPRLWEIETAGYELTDGQLKGGSQSVRLLREIPLPAVTVEQRIRFAILCGQEVYADAAWNLWADNWLSGKDRTATAATAAFAAANAAARDDARDAAAAAADAAYAAAYAAYAAADAAFALTADAAAAAADAEAILRAAEHEIYRLFQEE